MLRGLLALGLVACGGPTADIVCSYTADGPAGEDEGEYVAFTMSCDDYLLAGPQLALTEVGACEDDQVAGGAESAVCICTAEPGRGCDGAG